jgi:hypothetical protein
MTDISKVKLFGGINFWARILITMDRKLQTLCQEYGYGEIGLKIVVHRGKVVYSLFSDEIRIKEGEDEGQELKNT